MINHVKTVLINQHHTHRPEPGVYGESYTDPTYVAKELSDFAEKLRQLFVPAGDSLYTAIRAKACDAVMYSDRYLRRSYYPDPRRVYVTTPTAGVTSSMLRTAVRSSPSPGRAAYDYRIIFGTFPAASVTDAVTGETFTTEGTSQSGYFTFELPGLSCSIDTWDGVAEAQRIDVPQLDFFPVVDWAKRNNDQALMLMRGNDDFVNSWRSDLRIHNLSALLYALVTYMDAI